MERNGKWENGKMEKMEKMGKWENGAEWGMSSRRVHSPPTAEHTLVPEDRRARQSSASQSNKIFCRQTRVYCVAGMMLLSSRRVVGINAVKPKSGRVHSSDYNNIVNRQLCQANIVWEKNTLNEQHCSSEHCKHTSKEPMISHVTLQRCLWVWDQQISLLSSAMSLVKPNFRGDQSASWQFAGRGSYLSLMQ